jgi:hypothetical protein
MSASQLLSGTPAAITTAINVDSIIGDVDGAFTIQNSSADVGASVQIENLGGAGISLQAVGGGDVSFDTVAGDVLALAPNTIVGRPDAAGGDGSLWIQTQNAADDVTSFRWVVGGTGGGGNPPLNRLTLYSYTNGAFGRTFLKSGDAAAGGAGGFGTMNFTSTQCGRATIPLGANNIAVANTVITANSVVLASISANAAPDATLTGITNIVLNPGVGFTIRGNANATAAVNVAWWMPDFDFTL